MGLQVRSQLGVAKLSWGLHHAYLYSFPLTTIYTHVPELLLNM